MDFINKIFKGDKVIWAIFTILCIISIFEVFSAASTLTYKSGNHWNPVTQHTRYLAIGLGAMILVQNIRYQWFKLGAYALMPISLILLVAAILFGADINGATRWLSIFGIQFQPSEVAKIAVICFIALILSKYQKEEHADPKALYYIGAGVGLFAIIIAMDNLSTALLFCLVAFMMLIVGQVKTMTLVKSMGIAMAGVLAIIGLSMLLTTFVGQDKNPFNRVQTWVNRLTNHFNNDDSSISISDYLRDNAQRGHANIAIASSHVIGVGPGNSVQRDFLSQAFSDFIYAIIIEELGLLGGAIVMFLYLLILNRILKIAKRCQDRFSTFLVIAIGLMLVTQAMVNMMVAVEILPITGQPLPLISKGGSSSVINCIMLGMVLSVSYFTELDLAKKGAATKAAEKLEGIPEVPQSAILIDDKGFEDEKR